MDTIDTLFKEFGHIIGIPELGLDENGYCCLFFDGIVLNLEADQEASSLHLYANVGEIPDPVTTGFYEMLLEANFFYRGTGGPPWALTGWPTSSALIIRFLCQT